jgi:hypothetical protein
MNYIIFDRSQIINRKKHTDEQKYIIAESWSGGQQMCGLGEHNVT